MRLSPILGRRRPIALLAGGAAVTAAGVARLAARRAPAPSDPEPAPADPPGLPAPTPYDLTLTRVDAEPDLPRAVTETYREARRAFNAAREVPGTTDLQELRGTLLILWSCATLAESASPRAAKRLARETRGLLRLVDERRAVLDLAEATERHTAPSAALQDAHAHLLTRAERLERRIGGRGRKLFSDRPARILGRIVDDR